MNFAKPNDIPTAPAVTIAAAAGATAAAIDGRLLNKTEEN